MASPDPHKTPSRAAEIVPNPATPSDLLGGSNGGLHIPISNDSGFYGYNDEKHLQHVSIPTLIPLPLGLTGIIDADGREAVRPTQGIDKLRRWEGCIQVWTGHDLGDFGH